MINNGFYAKSETFGGNGRRTPITMNQSVTYPHRLKNAPNVQ